MELRRQSAASVALRPPETVMRLARLGSFHPCRLSFMRALLRRMKRENWTFQRPIFEIDERGVGVAVYSAQGPERSYSLIAFGHDLPPEQRSDRVIAHAWDSTFTLFDGRPTAGDIQRLFENVPKQEAGRFSDREICISRANRSVRLFEHAISCLAAGHQPDRERMEAVGYLMRTTAVYGSGKFGAADREAIAQRPEFAAPFQAEMLSVFLIRAFTLDLLERLAYTRAPETAVGFAPALRRRFGVGNSTGLGLAPFLINHPVLLNNWIAVREQALARVRALSHAAAKEAATFRAMLARARISADEWRSEHPLQIRKLTMLRGDLARLEAHIAVDALAGKTPWDRLYTWAEAYLSLEGQEQLVSLMLEPYGAQIDQCVDHMGADEDAAFPIDGAMTLDRLDAILGEVYGWALKTDWSATDSRARVWYISQEKLEPRLGERFAEPLEAYEQPLAPGRDAAILHSALRAWDGARSVAAFLLRHPEHRHIVRRAQIARRFPYAEIRDNTISAALLPIDLLRCKLAFFGATHFDPRSDRWVRINMFQDAPFPHELSASHADDWSYPPLPEGVG